LNHPAAPKYSDFAMIDKNFLLSPCTLFPFEAGSETNPPNLTFPPSPIAPDKKQKQPIEMSFAFSSIFTTLIAKTIIPSA